MAINVGELEVTLKTKVRDYVIHHVFYLTLFAVSLFCGYTWLHEHDARLLADQQVKISETKIEQLQTDTAKILTDRDATIAQLQKQRAAVKTVEQAITAMPDVSALPVTTRTIDGQVVATVEPIALFNALNQCKQDAVARSACESIVEKKDEIIGEQKTEITALKKKPGFWKRVGRTLKTSVPSVAIGIIIKAVLL